MPKTIDVGRKKARVLPNRNYDSHPNLLDLQRDLPPFLQMELLPEERENMGSRRPSVRVPIKDFAGSVPPLRDLLARDWQCRCGFVKGEHLRQTVHCKDGSSSWTRTCAKSNAALRADPELDLPRCRTAMTS